MLYLLFMGKLLAKSQMDVRIVSPETVEEYVNASTVLAKEGRKCVDGRYLPEQATGMIARPGGDGGYVMALMAVNRKKNLGLTPEQCFNAVYNAVKDDSGFCMHTDHNSDPDDATRIGLIGCGHMAKAATRRFCGNYDVKSEDVVKVIAYARNVREISNGVHIVNLTGEHKERGVLIVKSDTHSVLADNPKLSQMYFIYDEKRDNEFLKKLVKELDIPGVTYQDMKTESDMQLQATLQLLALHLPIFTVSFDGTTPTVIASGIVEPKPQPSRMPILKRLALRKLQRFTHKFHKSPLVN